MTQAKEDSATNTSTKDGLIGALQNPDLYDHPVNGFSVIETHISWVLLTGNYVYKIKKPVDLGFVDFTTLAKRQYYCNEELRLNKRFAPEIYLELVSIHGSPEQPSIGGHGEAIEYAVKMKQFLQQGLLSTLASEHKLRPCHIDHLANLVAKVHSEVDCVEPEQGVDEDEIGSVKMISKWCRENFTTIENSLPKLLFPDNYRRIKTWSLAPNKKRLANMKQRLAHGFIRECHGDLHLANIVLIDNQVQLFDCLEFNAELRWIDTMSDVAFVAMDLSVHGDTELAWRFINRYLDITGDFHGLAIFRYYFVYRAMVRAKVEALRITQKYPTATGDSEIAPASLPYLKLAHEWIGNYRPAIIVMHGLSGSGKSTVASQLVEQIGAIQIRSDLERKRIFGLEAEDDSSSELDQGIYNSDATQQTYHHLALLARQIVLAGFTVIVDASFLKLNHRNQFKQLALANQTAHLVISCEAPEDQLRERIVHRSATQNDPSEANIAILEKQLKSQDKLSIEELTDTYTIICTEPALNTEQLQAITQHI
ncbi:MAG: aminoglycoside phosphotransferase family enzyme/predicted kinase [Gammaproteobacteria bacterium]|jgi:aminoglycoside phosphotransferase family enzyme/predicted kinase